MKLTYAPLSFKIGDTDGNKGQMRLVSSAKGWEGVDSFQMANNKEDAVAKARKDLAHRLGVTDQDVSEHSVEETDFPDTALGAGGEDEMSGQMITSGWRIRLKAKGQSYEYRADRNQLRLYNYKGKNHLI